MWFIYKIVLWIWNWNQSIPKWVVLLQEIGKNLDKAPYLYLKLSTKEYDRLELRRRYWK